MRSFIAIAGYRARDSTTSLCYSQDNQTIISCELAAMTRIIKLRFTKDLIHHTANNPDTIIPYSREQMHILWNYTFPHPTHLPISVTLNDNIQNYNCLWIVNRKHENTNVPLTKGELADLKNNLPKTVVIVAIHGGALVMGSAGHLVPYLTLLSSYIGDEMGENEDIPPILAFDYRLAPECIFPCQRADVSFIVNKYLHQELGVDMNKIFLIGDSAGGSLALLFMQKMAANTKNHIHMNVGGAVLLSPSCDWTLNNGKGSWASNDDYDPIIFYETIKLYRSYAFGVYDVDAKGHKVMRDNHSRSDEEQCQVLENRIRFDSPRMSPCYGSFEGLPSLYVTVSELEVLYDDAVRVVNQANEAKNTSQRRAQYENIEYILEVNKGSPFHELPLMAGVIPEATNTLKNIARFLVNLIQLD